MLKTKVIMVGLAAALAVFGLAGCSGSNAEKSTDTAKAPESSQAAEPDQSDNAGKDDADAKADQAKQEAEAENAATGNASADSADTQAPSASEGEDTSAAESTTNANAGDSVEIVIPAGFMDDVTQEQLDEGVVDGDYQSATLNEDGSITFVVTQEQRDEYEAMLRDSIQQGLDELMGPDGIPDVVAIEPNENYTSFTVTTEAEEVGAEEAFSILAFAMYGGMYNAILGTEIDNVHVDFVNATTGEVLESIDTKDMGNETE